MNNGFGLFEVPDLSYGQIREIANNFRDQYCNGTIPINVEGFVYNHLNMDLDPYSGLYDYFQSETILMADMKTIIIDQHQYMTDSYQPRIRFAMAREIGHVALHHEIYGNFNYSSPDEYIQILGTIPEFEYYKFEKQANEFAGVFLVPLESLQSELHSAIQVTKHHRILIQNEYAKDYISNSICRRFDVPWKVIRIRIDRENLWQTYLN
jgi:Zn-dependent peptidase ImmA (M78 family)